MLRFDFKYAGFAGAFDYRENHLLPHLFPMMYNVAIK